MAKKSVAPKGPQSLESPEVVQVTVLADASTSMRNLWPTVLQGVENLVKTASKYTRTMLRVESFNMPGHGITMRDFYDPPGTATMPQHTSGDTFLWGTMLHAAQSSVAMAMLTPEVKTHHVIVVFTDGGDTYESESANYPAQLARFIADHSHDVTWFFIDMSGGVHKKNTFGFKTIPVTAAAESLQVALKEVTKVIGQIEDNVQKKLPITSGLSLPPAK